MEVKQGAKTKQPTVELSPNLSDKAIKDYQLVRKAIDKADQKAYAELMSRYKDSIYFMHTLSKNQ